MIFFSKGIISFLFFYAKQPNYFLRSSVTPQDNDTALWFILLRYPGKGWIFYDLYDGWMTLRLGDATF